jgi:hypothetical protein
MLVDVLPLRRGRGPHPFDQVADGIVMLVADQVDAGIAMLVARDQVADGIVMQVALRGWRPTATTCWWPTRWPQATRSTAGWSRHSRPVAGRLLAAPVGRRRRHPGLERRRSAAIQVRVTVSSMSENGWFTPWWIDW